ncbi:MAG TPA: chemotaxis protein CheB, partial [Kofleriaceae bacterium]
MRSLFEHAGCEVVATTKDPTYAMVLVSGLDIDVVILDLDSPWLNALEFLERLMIERPTPVVVLSSATEFGTRQAMRALALGAVELVAKPAELVELARKVERSIGTRPQVARAEQISTHESRVIAIGAATGGTEAISNILVKLPATSPGIAIAQHLPATFMESFAKRLDRESRLSVRVARDGDRLKPGTALLAPGECQMRIVRRGDTWQVRLDDDDHISRQRPSVDTLFDSFASAVGSKAIGVLLTGAGTDGARGLLAMNESGAA